MGLPQNDLFTSKHNPSFVDRTLAARLEIEDLLSSMRRQLAMIVLSQDEDAFQDLYKRVKSAGEGFAAKQVIVADRKMNLSGDVWYRRRNGSTVEMVGMGAQFKVGAQEIDESMEGVEDDGGEGVAQ